MGVVRRAVVLQDLAAARGRLPEGAEIILQRDGQAGERPQRLALSAAAIDLVRLTQDVGLLDVQERL